jgi:tetratricopeptide (TPR) repeat protein
MFSRAHASRHRRDVVRALDAVPPVVAVLLGCLFVGGMAAANGAYFPSSWGWPSIGLLWIALVALLVGRPRALPLREWLFLGGLAAFVGWVALSAAWSNDQPQTVFEVERDLVYVAAVLAVLVTVRQRSLAQLLGGLLAGIAVIAAYALATRLFPERLGRFNPIAVYRLSRPLGYWNALACLTAMGSLLAVGFAARGASAVTRAAASASLVVLLPVLYFTYGRGAIIAFCTALLVLVAVDRARLQLLAAALVAAPAPALAVWLASHSSALTTQQAPLAEATRQGHRLALIVALLAAAAAVASLLLTLLARRATPGRVWRKAFAAALLLAAAIALTVVFGRYGSPDRIARRVYSSFTSRPVRPRAGASLNNRLLSLSSNGRVDLWHVAWEDAAAHPVVGSGAGTYEIRWTRERPYPGKVRDAHSLYLETLAELGWIGLILLVVALGAPLLGIGRARAHPLGSAAVAAYCAYLLHAAADWDWEMPAVTTAALLCAASILIAARRAPRRPLGEGRRLVLAAATVPLLAFCFVALIGNRALVSAQRAEAAHEWKRSESHARTATRWAPWSSDALDALGNAQYALGRRGDAYKTLRKAVREDPNDWSIWYDLGDAAPTRTLALAAYRRAALLNPRSPNIDLLRRLRILPPSSGSAG